MALGNTYQNNKNQMWEASYYSRLRIKNPKDNLALGFTFWKGTLKVSISSLSKDYHTNDNNSDLTYIHLSPTKARLLANLVQTVIEQKSDNIFGVDTGIGEVHGFIAVGREQGNPFLLIAKVNPDGTFESSHKFNFNMNYNYSLKVHDIKNLKCQKEYDNELELQQLYDILADYARFSSGAIGASVYDIGRYEAAKMSNMVRKIAEKTGAIEFKSNDNSFFNSHSVSDVSDNVTKSRYQSINDLDNELG